MVNSDTARSRAPRGTKSVTDAFFSALHELPEIRQSEVAKAAQIAIRDALKLARDKAKAAKLSARGACTRSQEDARETDRRKSQCQPRRSRLPCASRAGLR